MTDAANKYPSQYSAVGFANAVPSSVSQITSAPISPLQILRTILCANPTAEQVMAALEANGLAIVPKANGLLVDLEEGSAVPVLMTEVDNPLKFIKEVMARHNMAPGALAIAVGISPSTLTRALNDPNHKFTLSTKTIRRIKEWDKTQAASLR